MHFSCPNSNTATTSESGNGGYNSRTQNKATGSKETNENNSAGDSGENGKINDKSTYFWQTKFPQYLDEISSVDEIFVGEMSVILVQKIIVCLGRYNGA